ncbi:MAG TPA: hypothetical protein V6D06_09700 [Trichocoleus sp.]
MPDQSNRSLDDAANQSRGVRVSAEQEMLSSTDQADLDTALHGMNIPLEEEGEDEEFSTSQDSAE